MNAVEASLEFFFKGRRHTPSSVIPLDACMRHEDPIVHMYNLLAVDNGIGTYSHEFDIMVLEPLHFANPIGLATGFVKDGLLDLEGYREAWLAQSVLEVLKPIATKHLGITDLDEHPDIKAALIAAYQAQ